VAKPPKPKKPKPPAVTAEERALFLGAIGGAVPLGARDRLPVPPPPPAVVRVSPLPVETKLAVEGDSARYSARAPGVSLAQVAELRRARAEETLDLHGDTTLVAIERLGQFLVQAKKLGRRCVRVIHGKGTHSEHGAPLREAVLAALLGKLSGFVHALATAAPADGGEGATTILLRS
jgi:DNA-nicking Smr family endonuclease